MKKFLFLVMVLSTIQSMTLSAFDRAVFNDYVARFGRGATSLLRREACSPEDQKVVGQVALGAVIVTGVGIAGTVVFLKRDYIKNLLSFAKDTQKSRKMMKLIEEENRRIEQKARLKRDQDEAERLRLEQEESNRKIAEEEARKKALEDTLDQLPQRVGGSHDMVLAIRASHIEKVKALAQDQRNLNIVFENYPVIKEAIKRAIMNPTKCDKLTIVKVLLEHGAHRYDDKNLIKPWLEKFMQTTEHEQCKQIAQEIYQLWEAAKVS